MQATFRGFLLFPDNSKLRLNFLSEIDLDISHSLKMSESDDMFDSNSDPELDENVVLSEAERDTRMEKPMYRSSTQLGSDLLQNSRRL